MGLFGRRSAKASAGGAEVHCDFCGRTQREVFVRPLPNTGDHSAPPEYACAWCMQKYDRLEARFTRASTPHDGWLLPDAGTERMMTPAPHAFDSAQAVVRETMRRAADVPRAVARITVLRNSVFVAASPTAHGHRDEAVTEISRRIAHQLEQGYWLVQEHPDLSTFGLSMHGGSVLSFQEIVSGGLLQAQFCYVIDTHNALHSYCSYHR